MVGVIKAGRTVTTGRIRIDNGQQLHEQHVIGGKATEPEVFVGENFGGTEEENQIHDYLTSEEVTKQLEALRDYYIQEGQITADNIVIEASKKLARAEDRAEAVHKRAEAEANEIIQQAKEKAEQIKDEARKTAFAAGYDEGHEAGRAKGYEDGYIDGVQKCTKSLNELIDLNQDINAQKETIAEQYESDIFDMIFEIANKITVDCFREKDKATLIKIIRTKLHEFTNTSKIRITLSALDISEDFDADLTKLKDAFSSLQEVEFEILKEAEAGTLILDNGSEIVDASVSTQLKMIEELGKGKYKNKSDGSKKSSPSKRPRKPTNPLMSKIVDIPEDSVEMLTDDEVSDATLEDSYSEEKKTVKRTTKTKK